MDTNDIVKKYDSLILRSLLNNLKVRFYINPTIVALYMIYFYMCRANDIHVISPIFIIIPLFASFLCNVHFSRISKKLVNESEPAYYKAKLQSFNLILISSEMVYLSVLTPFIGGIVSPFIFILVMEITALTMLFSRKLMIIQILYFIMVQVIFLFIKPLDSFNYFVFGERIPYLVTLFIFAVLLVFVSHVIEILIKPLYLGNEEVDQLKKMVESSEKLKRTNVQLEQLTNITKEIVSTKNIDNILQLLVEGVKNVLSCEVVLLSLYDKKDLAFRRTTHSGLSDEEWKKVNKQLVPLEKVEELLKDEFKITGGFFIPGAFADRISFEYSLSIEEKREFETLKEGDWHPEDILLFPITGRYNEMLGYFTVDSPLDRKIPSETALQELLVFINTTGFAIQNLMDYSELRNLYKNLRIVYTVNEMITKLSREPDYLEKVVKIIKESLGYLNVAILLKDDNHLKIAASVGYDKEALKDVRLKVGKDGITGWVAEHGISQIVNDTSKDPRYIEGAYHTKSELSVPIKFGSDEILGVLDFESQRYNDFTSKDMELLSLVANQLAIALKNNQLFEKTLELAKTDDLTGLYNYRYFRETLLLEISRSARYSHPFSLIMFDIDNFKSVNDTFGHPQGDIVLRGISKIVRNEVRDTDIIARYGGEEFIIVLPETEKKYAFESANRIRISIINTKFPLINTEKSINVSVSLGVASFPKDGETDDKLVQSVDNALYMAKRKGKNRVENA